MLWNVLWNTLRGKSGIHWLPKFVYSWILIWPYFQHELKFCKGYRLTAIDGDLWENFPKFQLLGYETVFTIENGTFHHFTCSQKHYILEQDSVDGHNTRCHGLQYHNPLKVICTRANTPPAETLNNCYLTFSQLTEKLRKYQQDRVLLKFENLQYVRKNARLCQALTMHERFVRVVELQMMFLVYTNW